MLDVIVAKPHRGRHGIRQIGEDAGPFVPHRLFENGVVAGVVNDDEHGVIGECADTESDDQREPPVAKAEMSEKTRDRDLANHDAKRNDRRNRIMADQPRDLRMRLEDRATARRMGPRRLGQQETVWPRDRLRRLGGL